MDKQRLSVATASDAAAQQLAQAKASKEILLKQLIELSEQLAHSKAESDKVEQRLGALQAAKDVENAGAAAIVLEVIPHELAGEITEALSIPTIGIGAGPRCDGQVLVFHDLLGFDDAFRPRFVKRYASAFGDLTGAVEQFVAEVRDGAFPTLDHALSLIHI